MWILIKKEGVMVVKKVVIAPDSFKGSLSALDVAKAMAKGIQKRWADAEIHLVPMADGGEGTTLALVQATGGALEYSIVSDPLGQPVKAHFGVLGDGKTAVVEVAQASGLPLVPMEKRNPLHTSSYGTGQLIKKALDHGCNELILGIGGSATNDGAMGLLTALGVIFLDNHGQPLVGCGGNLHKIHQIDVSELDQRLKEIEIKVACDVTNPLCGVNGASAVYGPQKGATPDMIEELDRGLAHYAQKIEELLGVQVAELPGAGAAGGIGAGLMAFLGAQLIPGVQLIIEVTQMEQLLPEADLIITGEGQTDGQTVYGKAPVGVAQIAKKYQKPVICISGSLGEKNEAVLAAGIDAMFSICSGPISLETAMKQASELITATTFQVANLWHTATK